MDSVKLEWYITNVLSSLSSLELGYEEGFAVRHLHIHNEQWPDLVLAIRGVLRPVSILLPFGRQAALS